MEMLVRKGGETTIYRGKWGAQKQTRPLFNFSFGWGLELSLELPSTWHEEGKLAMLRITPIWGHFMIWFPWYRLYMNHYQCSGPQFGFNLTPMGEPDGTVLFLYYGNDTGYTGKTYMKLIYGPWAWGTCVRWDKSDHTETYDYEYTLKSGVVQHVEATIRTEEMEWRRWWLPWRKIWHGIHVEFDDEVGERAGSWKGGTTGCGYELLDGETPLKCLRRMEREREFR